MLLLLILWWDDKQYKMKTFPLLSILMTKFYCVSPSFILFYSTNMYGMFAMYTVAFPRCISLILQNARLLTSATTHNDFPLSFKMSYVMIPDPLSIHNQVTFWILKHILRLCQTKSSTVCHLWKMTHHHFWNGKHWTFALASATVRLQSGFRKDQATPSLLLALDHLPFLGDVWTKDDEPSPHKPFRVCAWTVGHRQNRRHGGRRRRSPPSAGQTLYLSLHVQHKNKDIDVTKIYSCGYHQFPNPVCANHIVK